MTLLEKLKKSRQTLVTVEERAFTIRRPTPMEALEWLGNIDGETTAQWFAEHFNLNSNSWRAAAWYAVTHFVDGWALQEIDLVPGGTGADVPFDTALLQEWLLDNPATLNGLAVAIFQAWLTYLQARDDDQKKSQTGSTIERSMSSSAAASA